MSKAFLQMLTIVKKIRSIPNIHCETTSKKPFVNSATFFFLFLLLLLLGLAGQARGQVYARGPRGGGDRRRC